MKKQVVPIIDFYARMRVLAGEKRSWEVFDVFYNTKGTKDCIKGHEEENNEGISGIMGVRETLCVILLDDHTIKKF